MRMSEGIVSARECNISMIDIPSVAETLDVMTSEISNASQIFSRMKDALNSLQQTILNSHCIDSSIHLETAAVRQSAHNLECNFEPAVREIQERITLLEEVLERKATIPAVLTSHEDISAVFHIAVNGPEIDWLLAEVVLERFLSLWTEEKAIADSEFRQNVWYENDFDSNIVTLFQGGDCWRVRKVVELIQK